MHVKSAMAIAGQRDSLRAVCLPWRGSFWRRMTNMEPTGGADEIACVVAAYFEVLASDRNGIQVNKAARYRQSQAAFGRT